MKKTLFISTLFSILTLSACTEEEITNFFGGDNNAVTVSGKTNNTSDTAEPDVSIEGIYVTPGDASNPSDTSNTDGDFSLQLAENDSFYLRASKSGFVNKSTKKMSLSSDIANIVIEMPTEIETQDTINTAFISAPQLFNHAWLAVDVITATGDEANDYEIILSATPAGAIYTACDGTDSGATKTTDAPCTTDRTGAMFIAYYDTAGDVTVTVGDESQAASIRIGEFTDLKFELP